MLFRSRIIFRNMFLSWKIESDLTVVSKVVFVFSCFFWRKWKANLLWTWRVTFLIIYHIDSFLLIYEYGSISLLILSYAGYVANLLSWISSVFFYVENLFRILQNVLWFSVFASFFLLKKGSESKQSEEILVDKKRRDDDPSEPSYKSNESKEL